jgi:hypothetical protein
MLRFVFSLVAASLIAFAGYAALGNAATPSGPTLKVIAVVVAHSHRHTTASAARTQEPEALVQ